MTEEELEFMFRYWCCLPQGIRTTLRICIAAFQTRLGYIPKEIFDQAWETAGYQVDDFYYPIFLTLYPLHLVELTIPDVGDVDVYEFIGFWWFQISAFTETPMYFCPDPCRILEYSG